MRGPRSDQAPSGCEPDVDSPTQATARGSHCGRIWSILARCRLLATCGPIFFSTSVTGLQRRRFRIRDFGIEPERIELAVKRRAPDAQPPRDLGHLPAVMADGEADGLGFDVRKRAHVATPVEQRDGGLVAEAAHRLVWEAALHRSFVDDQTALAHAATSQPCAELGTVADRTYRGVKNCARCLSVYGPHIARDFEYRAATVAAIAWWPVDPRRSRAISIIRAPPWAFLATSRNHRSFATCHARTSKTRRRSTSAQVPAQVPSPKPPRRAAGMEPRRSLCRDRRSAGEARPRSWRRRKPGVRGGLQGQARGARRATRCGIGASRGGETLRGAR